MKIAWLPQDLARPRLTGMDSWRGVAALLVFFFHFWTIFLSEKVGGWFGMFEAGHLGVDMFFVLSGFLVTLSWLFTQDVKKYAGKRFRRIVPLAWVSAGVIFVYNQDWSLAALTDLAVHLSFTQSLFQEFYHGAFPVMWTLTVEMLFYALVPLLFWLGGKKIRGFFALLVVLLGLNFWYRYQLMDSFGDWSSFERIFHSEQLWGRFDQFAVGMLVALAVVFQEKIRGFFRYRTLIFAVGAILFVWSFGQFAVLASGFRDLVWAQVWLHAILGLGFGLMLWALTMTNPKKLADFLPFEFLGKISYGIYLWHFFVQWQVFQYVKEPAEGFLLSLGITLVLATLSWYLVEQPFLKRRK